MTLRFGEAIRPDIRYKTRPGVYVILPLGDQILLTHQASPRPEFQLPGGGIDPGEQPVAALHREVMEETGWTIGTPMKLGFYRRFCYMPEYDLWAEKVCHIYIARPVRRLCDPLEAGHTAVWMPKADAELVIASAGDRAFVAGL